jgi:hypothetical protein
MYFFRSQFFSSSVSVSSGTRLFRLAVHVIKVLAMISPLDPLPHSWILNKRKRAHPCKVSRHLLLYFPCFLPLVQKHQEGDPAVGESIPLKYLEPRSVTYDLESDPEIRNLTSLTVNPPPCRIGHNLRHKIPPPIILA